jgi:hypothetical protein
LGFVDVGHIIAKAEGESEEMALKAMVFPMRRRKRSLLLSILGVRKT